MVAVLILVLITCPFLLWIFGAKGLAIFTGIYVALSIPSIIHIVHITIRDGKLPKVVGGPGLSWAGKPVTYTGIKKLFKKAQ